MKFTLRQLEVFAAIARTDNVSRASEVLSMSQSAASSALVELERQFACPLFDRIGKSLRLNSIGRGLLPQVDDLLTKAGEIEGFLAGGKLGPLAVGATLTIGNYLATLIVAEYLQRHPESRVDLKVSNTRQVLDRLLRCELDVGLIEGEANDPDLVVEPWLDDELVVFCAPQHPLAQVDLASNRQLSAESWILRERGSGTRALFDRVVAPALAQVNIQLQLEHTEAIKRVVEAGLGLSCLSRVSLRDAFRRGSLVEIKTPQFNLQRHFHFVQHRQRHISPANRSFLTLCREWGSAAEMHMPLVP